MVVSGVFLAPGRRSTKDRSVCVLFQRNAVWLLLLVAGATVAEPQEGYFYPRPTPQCLPQVFTETVTDYATETLNHFFTDVNTVYLTDYLTSTVVNPVLITSTEYSVSTVVVPQVEYITETTTLVLQPSPVVQYVTETFVSTVFAQSEFSGAVQPVPLGNTYLPPSGPPEPNPVLINHAINQLQQPPPFIPPPRVSLPPVLDHPVTHEPFLSLDVSSGGQRTLGGPAEEHAFGSGVYSLPNIGAVPPAFDNGGYRYKRKLNVQVSEQSSSTTVATKTDKAA
ncbi:hypothetical protein ZHAS_00003011 [Anopheles sinensis]|uniref:Uncharacterized protein n=1 Tax=Anopheles sinensis TaxID=74873 RepID=A0A084VDI3_ANOSI|nr:hypothetical protein ZHAS_00003011 [Anopheles sinensis]